MRNCVDRLPAARWSLPLLVVLLVLGHACELPAYVELVSHHAPAGQTDEPVDSCDTVSARSSTGPQVWAGLDVVTALPVIDMAPVGRIPQSFEGSVKQPSRLPLFLLHSALLI